MKKSLLRTILFLGTPLTYMSACERHRLWNEQYLLEAFLSCNDQFEIIAASNYLSHHYRELFAAKCPVFGMDRKREPGSFWIRRKKQD